jgi:hypothetical protein
MSLVFKALFPFERIASVYAGPESGQMTQK